MSETQTGNTRPVDNPVAVDESEARTMDLAVGGQALIEGVMMRSPSFLAMAVRTPDGRIVVRKKTFGSIMKKLPFLNIPVIRGGIHLIETMGEDGVVFLDVTDPFHESCLVRGGMEKLLMDYILNPGLVHDVARIVTDYKLAVIDMAVGFGVEFIVMGGGLAGELQSRAFPRRPLLPEGHRPAARVSHSSARFRQDESGSRRVPRESASFVRGWCHRRRLASRRARW